jgi:hypothetical protein
MRLTPLTRDLLAWIAASPRSYAETMEAWRTSCPRLSIWEDAVSDGLVRVRAAKVELTAAGEAARLDARSPEPALPPGLGERGLVSGEFS